MKIGGFIKNNLTDYQGKVAAVVFTRGCNLRCKYCHDTQLVMPELFQNQGLISEFIVLDYLEKNKIKLDAVVISGGEPTLQDDLALFMQKVKLFGLYVKLNTNGTRPDVIERLINEGLVDYLAMDIKAPLEIERYVQVAGDMVNPEMLENIKKSIKLILDSGIKHEFRTTAVKEYASGEDMTNMAESVKDNELYWLKDLVKPEITLDESFSNNNGYSLTESESIYENLSEFVIRVKAR